MRLERHQIVHLDPRSWPDLIGGDPGLRSIPAVVGWVGLERPLIARRPVCGEGAGMVPLGLPLPPSLGKQRLALAAPPEAVLSMGSPPRLADAAAAAPLAWYRTIDALLDIDSDARCFGSLAWEYMTGLPYLSAASDLDLLWQAAAPADADRRVAAIACLDDSTPMRIDGEIVTPDGVAVQWREWASGAPQILCKTWDGSRLIARNAVFG